MAQERRRRRGREEGSIYRRRDGRWTGAVTVGYRNQRRVRKQLYGRTRKEVQGKITKVLRDHQQGLPVVIERQTVGQFLQYWLEHSAKPSLRPSTYASYSRLIHQHLIPALGRIPLQKLAPQHVQAFLNEKLASQLSPRTVQYLRAVLRRALGQAVKWSLAPRNVATLVDPPHVSRPHIEPLTPEEARAFLAAAKGDRLEALFTVAMAVGLRRGEALGLRWPDVDLEKGELRVRRALQRIDGKLELIEPKSAMSRRVIKLPEVVIEALRTHRVRQLENRLRGGSRWRERGFVFTTSVGTPLDHGTVIRRFHCILEKAGLRRQRFHDLRHACATLLLVQGVHPRVVMEILGHSQISLTLDTYSHVVPSLQDEAARLMDAALTKDRK